MGVLENTLSTVSQIVVYTPLVLLSLFIIFHFIKNISKWLNSSDKSWKNEPTGIVFIIMSCVGIFVGLCKLIINIIKKIYNLSTTKISLALGILSVVALLSFSYYYFIKGPHIELVKYSKIINVILVCLSVLVFFYLFFIKQDNVYNESNNFNDKGNWKNISKGLFRKSSEYLFLLICLGLTLGLVSLFAYFIFTYDIVSITSLWLVTIVLSISIMFILYTQLKKIKTIKNFLDNNKWFRLLYNFIFIIPCLFLETAKFIFNELKSTPGSVYKILFGEIVIITLFVIIPMITRLAYTTTTSSSNKSEIIEQNLESIDKDIIFLDKEINKWKNYNPIVKNENGEQSNIQTYSLSDNTWDYIIKNNLNNKNNEESLTNELINNGYKKENGLLDLIKYIQKNTKKILKLLNDKKELIYKKEEITKNKNNISSIETGKLLINKPHHLYIKRYTDDNNNPMDFQNLNSTNFHSDYNYNYSLSCWIFLHSTTNHNKGYKSIINYNDKPNILYNFYKNTLEIRMNNGGENKVIYKKKNFKLQKWRNIVVNYVGGVLDIFIDSKLVATYSGVVPYMSYDKISVGDNNGVSGGIANVLYFPTYMSKKRIDTNYSLFKNKIQPI